MDDQRVAKITISLPRSLLAYADRLAEERATSRSGVIAGLLKKEEASGFQALMAEGYQQMAEENLREAEEALNLTSEVMLRNESP